MFRYTNVFWLCFLTCYFALNAMHGCSGELREEQVKGDSSSRPESQIEFYLESQRERIVESDRQQKPSKRSLIDHHNWKLSEEKKDSFFSMKKKDHKCADGSYKVEDGVVEVDTGICSFITFGQKTLLAVQKGDKIRVVLWHLQLFSDPPAEGYSGISYLGKIRWFVKMKIPGEADVYDQVWAAKQDVPKGTMIYFHIHNHGTNTWKLLTIERAKK